MQRTWAFAPLRQAYVAEIILSGHAITFIHSYLYYWFSITVCSLCHLYLNRCSSVRHSGCFARDMPHKPFKIILSDGNQAFPVYCIDNALKSLTVTIISLCHSSMVLSRCFPKPMMNSPSLGERDQLGCVYMRCMHSRTNRWKIETSLISNHTLSSMFANRRGQAPGGGRGCHYNTSTEAILALITVALRKQQ